MAAYWDHDAANTRILTDKVKFNLFGKIFTVPHHLTTAMIALSDSLAEVYPLRNAQEQDTQGPGTAAVIGMCDTIGRIVPQDKIQEEFTEDFGTAIITTCKSLAGLFPQSKIQNRASTLRTDVQVKDVNIFTDVSPSASAHRPAIGARGMYMFQPLQEAYAWINDVFSSTTDQHPCWLYNYPEEHIFGCIYIPS
jgi:hypothetical protein